MDVQYIEKAAGYAAGTNGADPAYWERLDKAKDVLIANQLPEFVPVVDDQPLQHVIFLLEQGHGQARNLIQMRDGQVNEGAVANAQLYAAAANQLKNLM